VSGPDDDGGSNTGSPGNNGTGNSGAGDSGGGGGGHHDASSGGGSDSSSGGPDTSITPTAPTWGAIFGNYLAAGTPGDCGHCHGEMAAAQSAYTWLQGRGYIGGGSPALTDSSQSCLSWYGGNMPPRGPSSLSSAKADMDAWAAAGAQNN
jgi:hypothetical protein